MYPAKPQCDKTTKGLPSLRKFSVRLCIFMFVSVCLVLNGCAAVTPVAPPAATTPAPFIARITAFTGAVTVEDPLAGRRPPGLLYLLQPRHPDPMHTLGAGQRVNVGDGGKATILCVDNHIHLVGPGTYIVTEEWCGGGQPLPADSCHQTTGNVCKQEGSAVILAPEKDKENDYGNIPVILSPRQTHLLDPQPTIQWVSVDKATQYEVRLGSAAVKMKAEIACVAEEQVAPHQLCSLPWPADWLLEPGKPYTLVVAARRSVAEKWRESEPSELRTLDADTAAHLQADIAAVQALDLDPTTQNLALAGLYTRQQVYSQAIAHYEAILQDTSAPALFNTVGDLYRQVELQRYALKAYKAGLDLLDTGPDDPATRAAAEFGSGQAEYSRLRYTQAEPYFTRAVTLYVAMPVQEEYAAAEYALGYISAVDKKRDKAEQHYRKAVELYETLGLIEQSEDVQDALTKL